MSWQPTRVVGRVMIERVGLDDGAVVAHQPLVRVQRAVDLDGVGARFEVGRRAGQRERCAEPQRGVARSHLGQLGQRRAAVGAGGRWRARNPR